MLFAPETSQLSNRRQRKHRPPANKGTTEQPPPPTSSSPCHRVRLGHWDWWTQSIEYIWCRRRNNRKSEMIDQAIKPCFQWKSSSVEPHISHDESERPGCTMFVASCSIMSSGFDVMFCCSRDMLFGIISCVRLVNES